MASDRSLGRRTSETKSSGELRRVGIPLVPATPRYVLTEKEARPPTIASH